VIKITTGCLSRVGALVARRYDVQAVAVSPLQTLGGFVRLFE
jgi:hypothetical protein